MPMISTAAGAIFYAQRGTHGPRCVCIHGAGGTFAHWGYQLRNLSNYAQVFALDLPGHGRSALPGRGNIAAYGEVLVQWLDACELDQVALFGHSMGGAIALWVALEYPERVHNLGLVGTGAYLRVSNALLEGLQQNRTAMVQSIVDLSYAPDATVELRAQAVEVYLRCDPSVLFGDFVACAHFDLRARIGALHCPSTVICGAEDRMTPPHLSQALYAALPNATLTLVPHAGHMVLVEQPQTVSAVLARGMSLLGYR